METFIIGYMIVNEVAGTAMAVGFMKYLQKSGYFTQRKIEKWRSKKPYCDVEFWSAFNQLEEALEEAQSKGRKELYIIKWTTLGDAWEILEDDLGGIFTQVPFYVVKNLYRPAYQELMSKYQGIEIKHTT